MIQIFSIYIENLTQLKHLDLTFPHLYDVSEILKSKAHSSHFKIFKSNSIFEPDILLPMIENLPSITHISFGTQYNGIPAHLDTYQKFSLPSLISVEWNCLFKVPHLQLLKSLSNIQELSLKNAEISDSIIHQIKHFPYLHTFHLENISDLDDALLAEIATLPLETLTLKDCDPITENGLTALSKSKTLQKLTIHNCANIFVEESVLLQQFPQVREFHYTPLASLASIKNSSIRERDTKDRIKKILAVNPMNVKLLNLYMETSTEFFQIDFLKEVIGKQPMHILYWKLLGIVYFKGNLMNESIQTFAKALELGMDRSEIPNELQEYFPLQ